MSYAVLVVFGEDGLRFSDRVNLSGGVCYCPCIYVKVRVSRSRSFKLVKKPAYNNYAFVHKENIDLIRNGGANSFDFLRDPTSGDIAYIEDNIVDTIKEEEESWAVVSKNEMEAPEFEKGDKVEILGGLLKNMTGEVSVYDKKYTTVMVGDKKIQISTFLLRKNK